MSCLHLNCLRIDTTCDNVLIDINYQCSECGKVLSIEEYKQVLKDNCSWCEGSGYHEDQGEKYYCGCQRLEEVKD